MLNFVGIGQNLSNIVKKSIVIKNDSINFDSLSVVPGSFILSYTDSVIPQDNYFVDNSAALIILKPVIFSELKNKVCAISYRTFPYNFSQAVYHKKKDTASGSIKRKYISKKEYNRSLKTGNFSNLKKSGSISRGINIGNNQNAGLTSDFNLQLSGKINSETEIQANISDSNIPVQADGSSQNLREFDNVYIRLITDKSILTAGDFVTKPGNGYFMKFQKKVKGSGFETHFENSEIKTDAKIYASVSKGKFNRMKFNGTEGNQGPYRLTGKNGELYIVILSGSEKIYADGILLKRGNENDYIINYNSGELTFTSGKIITKDTRIIAEFEYSEMSYARFNYGGGLNIKTKNSDFFVNIISEQDAKNQNLRQDLSDEQKLIFYNLGDNINDAFIENVTFTDTFNRDEILYRKTDTTVQGVVFRDVYVYSTDSLNAKYRVNFSFIGTNRGNYIREKNGANGRVFKWVSPENGILQGEYEPVKLLISPKKKQMINIGASGKINETTDYYFETALTNNDLNTFSGKGDDDNLGYAVRGGVEKNILNRDTTFKYLKLKGSYGFINKNFEAFEPYRSPEFSRDWNLFIPETYNEHIAGLQLIFFDKSTGKFGASSDFLQKTGVYSGNKNSFLINISKKHFKADITANRLTTTDTANNSEFIRYKGHIETGIKKFKAGIINSGEKNLFFDKDDNKINPASFRFNEIETYLKSSDKSKNTLLLSYTNREDFLPFENRLHYASAAHNFKFNANFISLKHQKIKTVLNFRKLYVKDSILQSIPSENTLSGKFEYSFNIFKGAVSGSNFTEHSSGREAVTEFTYFEVPPGQGIFAWKDFNGNKIKELNEFVKATFEDEANYIRAALPSTEYRTVYNQSVFQTFNLQPKRIWNSEKGIKKFASFFSNRLTYRLNRKINDKANYFSLNAADSSLISFNKNLKNRLSFNLPEYQLKTSYTFINSETKNLLINGIESRNNTFHTAELYKKVKNFIFTADFKTGNKNYDSEFFTENNYLIKYSVNKISANYKIGNKNNFKTELVIKNKKNILGEENLFSYTIGGEYRLSGINKGSLQINFNFINIAYSGNDNTSISYEILEGLQNGKNYLWNIRWLKKLSNSLQLELNYSGRKTNSNKIIHTGGISIRAFF